MTTAADSLTLNRSTWTMGEHRFHTAMSVAIAVAVFVGFAPTFYTRDKSLPALPFVTVLHGVAFTAWVLAYIAQSALAASGRRRLHMRLGYLFTGLGVLITYLGVKTAVEAARRGAPAIADVDPRAFMVIPFFDIVIFAGLLAAGYLWRRSPDVHKRLMLLASIDLMGPALARVAQRMPSPLFSEHFPMWAFAGMLVFIATGCAYDWMSRRRIHAVYAWGTLVLTISGPVRFLLGDTAIWLTFVDGLLRWM